MAVVFDIPSMRDDLKAFGKAARRFIANPRRLRELESQLSNAAAEAKRGDREVKWSTEIGAGPIMALASRSYRNDKDEKKILRADISFDFTGALDAEDDNRLVIRAGGTRVKLYWEGAEESMSYHFDIHPGAAGHPMLHIQFAGAVSEIPRLHSFLAHPLDVLEFTLMELFQEAWRKSRADATFASEVRKYPVNQRKRLVALLNSYTGWLTSTDRALIALLTSPALPLELYPS